MPSLAFIAPSLEVESFTCPHCAAYAHQLRFDKPSMPNPITAASTKFVLFTITRCSHCKGDAYWHDGAMIWPRTRTAPIPNPDMPDPVLAVYEEAAAVSVLSPRSAAALLRLAIQMLCAELDTKSSTLDDAIGELVERGLRSDVIAALDVVRVVGNNAVHPGKISFDDETGLVRALFELVNVITEQVVSEPKRIADLYAFLPEGAREAIERRNAKALPPAS